MDEHLTDTILTFIYYHLGVRGVTGYTFPTSIRALLVLIQPWIVLYLPNKCLLIVVNVGVGWLPVDHSPCMTLAVHSNVLLLPINDHLFKNEI